MLFIGVFEKYIYDTYYKKGMTKKRFVKKVLRKYNKENFNYKITAKHAKLCWNIGRFN